MERSQKVAHPFVDVLEKIGVKQIFGLIGDSLNPSGDAVRHSNIEWIGVRHEEGAALGHVRANYTRPSAQLRSKTLKTSIK